ncbi:MAG: mechanosensitive ion channel family protein [Spirochaetes bacterium]|nr:mechanosensitive ion channel family protein [Spirochaetota bacterium]
MKYIKNIYVYIKNFFDEFFLITIKDFFEKKSYINILRIFFFFIISIIFLNIIIKISKKLIGKKISIQTKDIIIKVIKFIGWAIIITTILRKLGIDLTAILGAAGIIGIAVGFAAQTSISNFISGFFLLSEKPFEIGDVIKVNNIMGIIDRIDLMAVKIRTFDNQMIRIPNEVLIKTEIINITKFKVRRMDILFDVEYGTDLDNLENILKKLAKNNIYVLEDPEPLYLINSLETNGIRILFGVYFQKENFVEVKNTIIKELLNELKNNNIKIAHHQIKIVNDIGI